MPGYVLAGLMAVTMLLPIAIAKVMEETAATRSPALTLVGAVMWVLVAGSAVVVWVASYEIHPSWWDGDSILLLLAIVGMVWNLWVAEDAVDAGRKPPPADDEDDEPEPVRRRTMDDDPRVTRPD